MPASWVGASVRARLLANRRLGRGGATAIARADNFDFALARLIESPYGSGVTQNTTLADAQRRVAATLLWNLRLIAGWLPPGGNRMLQAIAAWFEIANIEDRLTYLAVGGHPMPYQLGHLGVAWSGVSAATTAEAVREALSRSPWGDPESADPTTIVLWLRFRWASWIAAAVPQTAVWSAAASTLLAARVLFAPTTPQLPPSRHEYGLPPVWREAAGFSGLRNMLPRQTAWILDGVDDAGGLWRAEAAWWARVRRDAIGTLVRSRFGSDVVVAAIALLAHDAWLTRAALATVERGPAGRSVFDAIA